MTVMPGLRLPLTKAVIACFMLFCIRNAVSQSLQTCGDESCWRYPEAQLPESMFVPEDSAIATLLCYSKCLERLVPKVDECQGSCVLINSSPPLPFKNCTEMCEDSMSCQEGCRISLQPLSPAAMQPDEAPLVTMTTSLEEGVYTVSVPTVGSGENPNDYGDNEMDNVVYLIRIQDQFGNETYFPMTSSMGSLSLLKFACSKVNISYAVVTVEVRSEYSLPYTICVHLPQGVPGSVNIRSIEIEEDLDQPGHAIVTMSWTPPSEFPQRLEGYQLMLKLISCPEEACPEEACPEEACPLYQSTSDNITRRLDRELTTYTMSEANGFEFSLLYLCNYTATIYSLPGNESTFTNISIKYTVTEDTLQLECTNASFDHSTLNYTFSAQWSIAPSTLALEPLRDFKVRLDYFNTTRKKLRNGETEKKGKTTFEAQFSSYPIKALMYYRVRVIPLSWRIEKCETFFWRKPILPSKQECNVYPLSTPILDINVNEIAYTCTNGSNNDTLDVNVSWNAPHHLDFYELCIGEEGLIGMVDCAPPSASLCAQTPGIATPTSFEEKNCTTLRFNSSGHVYINIELPFKSCSSLFQIRAHSSYELPGSWSEPKPINLDPSPLPSPSESPIQTNISEPTTSNNGNKPQSWMYGVIVAVAVLLLILSVLVTSSLLVYKHRCFHRRIRMGEMIVFTNPSIELREDANKQDNIPTPDKWELKNDDVILFKDKPLGRGSFGDVYRGLLQERAVRKLSPHRKVLRQSESNSRAFVVALKLLKGDPDHSEKANFLKEIEMMKTVSGSHHNHQKFVVNMLGCVTLQEPMMLVLEYASHGDLLSYLRASRAMASDDSGDFGLKQSEQTPIAVAGFGPVCTDVNSDIPEEGKQACEIGAVTEQTILEFARQIAAGMEYLSSLGIVHRDLACRNILVGEGKVLKVSDFGMSRLLPPDEVYVPTSHGLLPLRWMAIEALFYRHFSSKTDVWSYGVLLWEICTMGEFPYPMIRNRDLPKMLRSGYRMDKPESCSEETYKVMQQCWNSSPSERPSFSEIHETFDRFLSTHTQEIYPCTQLISQPTPNRSAYNSMVDDDENPADPLPVNLDIETSDGEGSRVHNAHQSETEGSQVDNAHQRSSPDHFETRRLSPSDTSRTITTPDSIVVMCAKQKLPHATIRYVKTPNTGPQVLELTDSQEQRLT